MNKRALCSCIVAMVLPSVAAGSHTEAEKPAATGLLHSAVGMVHAPPETPARAGRLVVLTRYAARLDPEDAETCRLLAAVYESQGRLAEAADAIESCIAAHQDRCHHTNCRWLELLLRQRERAEQRVSLLEDMLADEDLPAGVRAVAAARLGRLHRGRGEVEQARLAYLTSLELDPTNPDAAEGLLAVIDNPTAVDEAESLLRLLLGNPKAVAIAWDLAALLDSLGLHERALVFFEHAWDTAIAAGGREALSASFVTEYFNTMLNAGMHAEAIRRFEPALEQFSEHLDLLALMVEAHRQTGDQDRAERTAERMLELYMPEEADEELSPQEQAELAWFHLMMLDDPPTAMEHAQRAAEDDPHDTFIRRVVAASVYRAGDPETARQPLEQLSDRDVYASVFLAELLFEAGESEAAAETLRSAVRRNRSGPAYRKARELAGREDIALPPAEQADETAAVIDRSDLGVLAMGRSPEEFVSAELSPTTESVQVGEPIVVEATLANIGDVDVTVGDWGLLAPRMSLEVELGEHRMTNMPLLRWPAPRRLAPGESVSASTRLDVAELEEMLARRPLERLTLTVRAVLDPVQTSDGIASALPQLRVEPISIVREALVGNHLDAQEAPVQITEDLRERLSEGSVEQRMLAARQIGSLLAAARRPREESPAPEWLESNETAEALLELLERALSDESPAVRAEMIAVLHACPPDEPIIARLGSAVTDASPLVRMRTAELLGVWDKAGNRPVLEFLAEDDDDLVRDMAGLFVAREDQ